jgi:predicted nucleotidyltransferase
MTAIQTHSVLPSIIEQITHNFSPIRIILFGSYAHGYQTEDSDLDIMVVLPYDGKSLDKSVEILSSLDPYPNVPLDLITIRPEEMSRKYAEGDPLIREVCSSGVILYEQDRS